MKIILSQHEAGLFRLIFKGFKSEEMLGGKFTGVSKVEEGMEVQYNIQQAVLDDLYNIIDHLSPVVMSIIFAIKAFDKQISILGAEFDKKWVVSTNDKKTPM